MSDPRVNLLPGEIEQENVRRRNLLLLGAGGLVVVALLVVGYLYQVDRVDDAEDRLAIQERELQTLQADLGRLSEFRDLQRQLETADQMIATALGGEVSFAGVLQDVAAVMPAEAELDSLDLTLTPEAGGGLGDRPVVLGRLALTGRSLGGHAPGLERLLLELEKIAAFSDLFVTSSSLSEETTLDVVQFNVEADLGPEARTGRYQQGLPEELE